ncbi:uncharacterized protein LY79DRAFT_229011 [Colletotrichum navitas]|uniref:Uncharacterized protein n=1 Tax=Colletotrichum navitas TaxID=681940 RepID=A0AAD8PYN1_9PEZI|nr:uncharacterized protein LY79DRAFT_229011 [Colletotrichum navitas]KAK1590077.1 hypothetical protein LY79DRAFT_229011 [Colletotrichum navitas]
MLVAVRYFGGPWADLQCVCLLTATHCRRLSIITSTCLLLPAPTHYCQRLPTVASACPPAHYCQRLPTVTSACPPAYCC